MDEKPKISNMEWGLVIGVLFTIDAIQVAIEWVFIWFAFSSVIINFCIDLLVGMSLALYLQLRGQSMANPKRLFGLLATFGLEMFPMISEFPLWGLDGIFNMMIYKSDKIVAMVPVAEKVIDTTNKIARIVPRTKQLLNKDSEEEIKKVA